MDKEFFIKLTADIYRLTSLFPKKEPLRFKMRETANEILTNLILILKGHFHSSGNLFFEAKKDIEALDGFFEVAKAQNWVSHFDISEIQEEYNKTKQEIEKILEVNFLPSTQTKIKNDLEKRNNNKVVSVNGRQTKILKVLKEKEKAQVWEFQKIFPEVTKRTLRRDVEFLSKQALIKRIGEKNNTSYQLNGRT